MRTLLHGALMSVVLALVGVALLLAPFASALPDGLEKVAHTLGFAPRAVASPAPSLLSDYTVPGLGSGSSGTLAAGITGALIVALLAVFVGRAVARGRRERAAGNAE